MASSLILTGGAAIAKTLKETVTQTAHGFTVSDVIRWDPSLATPKFVKASADSAANAEVAGVVNEITDPNNFQVTYHGYIDLPNLSGLTAPVMFLSSTAGGSLSVSPPSAVGTVVKPVLTRNSSGNGFLVMNYLGTQIGGSSTIAVDEIQPVGTIMPFAGSVIPETWLECNGASYSVSSYPELYAKLQNSSGDRVPAYGYVATLTGTNVSGVLAAGDYIQYKTDTVAWTGTGSPFAGSVSNAALLALVLSVTSTTAVVQVLPIYSGTTKNFTISNTVFGGGGFVGSETGTGNYRAYTSTSAFKAVSLTITGAVITHFNTPDLRGRFALGVNTSGIGELETDSFISAISGIYSLGSEGGEEAHTLTTAEMPAHKHKFVDWGGSAFAPTGTQYDLQTQATGNYGYADTDTKPSYGNASDPGPSAVGGNSSHNNMPPYTVVRYIIKAKPYTRAAIIDGIDLPYNDLLIRNLRTRNVGGSNGDLVFHTNTAGDSGNGTERMRLSTDGTLTIKGVGANDQLPELRVQDSAASSFLDVHSSVGNGSWNPLNQAGSSSIVYGLIPSGGINSGATLTICPWSNASNSGLVLSSSATETRVGIGTNAPGATLDVNGTVRIRGGGYPGISLNDRLVAVDSSGTLKWDNITEEQLVSVNMFHTTGYSTTLSATTATPSTTALSETQAVYTGNRVTLTRGTYVCQIYNVLTPYTEFRASAQYYGRAGLVAVSGTILGLGSGSNNSFPGVNFEFETAANGTAYPVASAKLLQQYETIPFFFRVLSNSAVLKGTIQHGYNGTISTTGDPVGSMRWDISRIG